MPMRIETNNLMMSKTEEKFKNYKKIENKSFEYFQYLNSQSGVYSENVMSTGERKEEKMTKDF